MKNKNQFSRCLAVVLSTILMNYIPQTVFAKNSTRAPIDPYGNKTFFAGHRIYPAKASDNGIYLTSSTLSYAPGDTLVLRSGAGPYAYFSLENIHGTAAAPVVIINEGGQVQVTAMAARHCTYLKFTGSGSGDQYGFYLSNPNSTAMSPAMEINGRSSDIEVERIDINQHGYGFWVKEEGSCDPTLQYPNWRINNISLHDNRIRNTRQEGFYCGSTAPNGERTVICNGVATNPIPLRLSNIRIYNNIVDHTGRGGIQLSSADVGNNEIFNNTVTNCGFEFNAEQGNGIVLGGYTTAYVHDNTIDYTYGTGIFSLGAGLDRIENNRIDHSGQLSGQTASGISSIMVDTRLTTPLMNSTFYIKNNTAGANTDYHIRIYNTVNSYSTSNNICNNMAITGGPATMNVPVSVSWMNCTAPTNVAPNANAGASQTISLPANSAILTGSGTDVDGTIAAYQWTELTGPNNAIINSSSSAQTTVSNLISGTYSFQLKVTDNGGLSATAVVNVTVNATSSGGSATLVRIEAENYVSMSGVSKETTSDIGGGLNVGSQDVNDWMDYSINLSSAGTYTMNLRIATMVAGAQFQVRKSDGTVLTTVSVPSTGAYQNWQTISAQVSLAAGQQTLRIYTTASPGGWNLNWFELATSASSSTNQTPSANAGATQSITLPASSATLNGSGTDADGSITAYAWTQVNGPNTAGINTPASQSTAVSGLIQGTYTFRLKVTDNAGASATNDVTVIVNAASSTPPVTVSTTRIEAENYSTMSGVSNEPTSDVGGGLNVGSQDLNDWADYAVNIPVTGTYTLNFRIATSVAGAQFQIRNPSGTVLSTVNVPSTGAYQNWQTISTQLPLPAGQQTLRFYTVASPGGWNLNWWEYSAGNSSATNQAPLANAGSAQTITLPASSATLVGSGTDADGSIASYSWSQLSGPKTAVIASLTSASTGISGMVEGSYTFRLSVTDNAGASATADVTVTVNPLAVTGTTTRVEAETYTSMNGVSKETTSDIGGGLNVGSQDVNDWADYAVNIPVTGTYTLNFRVATMVAGAQFQIRNASGTVLATVNVPSTGAYQNWQTISTQASLTGGQQTLRIYTVTSPGGWNLNWWEFQATGSSPSPAPVTASPIHMEAENWTDMNGVSKEPTSDAGGGYNVGSQDLNDWVDYSVNLSAAATYTMNFRIATMVAGAQFQIRNASGTVLATVSVPSTGAYQNWQTISAQISLPAGQQTLRIYTTASPGGWNLNWFEIIPVPNGTLITAKSTAASLATVVHLSVFPLQVNDRFSLKVDNGLSGKMNIQIEDTNGTVVKKFTLNKNTLKAMQSYLSIADLSKGEYLIRVTMKDWEETTKITKL